MTWTRLKTRLAQMPLVLAGPILRQVTPNAVTVWVALQRNAKVTLKVFESGSPENPLIATRTTTAVGKNLFITAVTARSETALVPNKIYCYDLSFMEQGPLPTTLGNLLLNLAPP